MEEKQLLSDINYWEEKAHIAFNFDDDVSLGATVPLVQRKENLQLIKYDGLSEAAENKTSIIDLSSQVIWPEDEKQVKQLVQKLNPLELSAKEEKEISKLTASQTVRNMILGLNYSLESFKGKESKIDLLKAAVQSHDGNAILRVLLFLRDSLKKSLFQKEIGMHTDAINMYLSYLEEEHEIDELTNMFLLLDNSDAAAMVKYSTAILVENPERKIRQIDNCLGTHFQTECVDEFLCKSVMEHKQLLREQLAINDHQKAANPDDGENVNLFQQLTNETNFIDTSVLCSLVFCSLFYYNTPAVSFLSPAYIRNAYNLSKKQYTWGIVRALAVAKRWLEMEELFVSKNWMGNSKFNSHINLTQLIRFLSKIQVPQEVISKYVAHMSDQCTKLSLAKKYKCNSIVIEILKNSRDRKALQEYKTTLPSHSLDFCTAADILNNKTIKWRN